MMKKRFMLETHLKGVIMKKLLLIFMLLFSISVYAGEEFVSITKTSKMKKYNKKAVWRKVKCKACHGTGSKTDT